jgi:ankyrin repeat protein
MHAAICAAVSGKKHDRLIELLATREGAEAVRHPPANATTAVHVATGVDDTNSFFWLLQAGAPADTRDEHGWTPMITAAQFGREVIFRHLWYAGADYRASTADGWTPFTSAASGGFAELLKMLVTRDVNLEEEYQGRTALIMTAEAGEVPAVQCLLKAGASVDSVGHTLQRETPLQAAAGQGMGSVVQCLLRAGASVNAVDAQGLTALDKAVYYTQVMVLLLAAGAHLHH